MEFQRFVLGFQIGSLKLNHSNYIIIQIGPCQEVYGVFYLSSKYKSEFLNRFLDSYIYTGELRVFLNENEGKLKLDTYKYLINLTSPSLIDKEGKEGGEMSRMKELVTYRSIMSEDIHNRFFTTTYYFGSLSVDVVSFVEY